MRTNHRIIVSDEEMTIFSLWNEITESDIYIKWFNNSYDCRPFIEVLSEYIKEKCKQKYISCTQVASDGINRNYIFWFSTEKDKLLFQLKFM